MIGSSRRLDSVHVYVGALGAALAGVVALSLVQVRLDQPLRWLGFVALFGVAEYVDIFFHHERGRQSLNPSEAFLLPMIIVLPFAQVVLGVVAAMLAISAFHWRDGAMKFVFNVAQYGCAAAAAAAVWAVAGTSSTPFTPVDAVVSIVAVLVFGGITHLLVAGVIALSERTSFAGVLGEVLGPAFMFLAINAVTGMLLAAAYQAEQWTIVLFPVMLSLLALGSRAVLRQAGGRERAEHLHTAASALVAGKDLESAANSFLSAVVQVMSAVEAVAVARRREGPLVFRASREIGEIEGATTVPLDEPRLASLQSAVQSGEPVVVTPQSGPPGLAAALSVGSLVAVPLMDDDDVVGLLVVFDRVGTDEFGPEDARLLDALGHELVLSLSSFRLFEQVAAERERFQQIFFSSQEGICLLDADGIVRAWNPALSRMSGRTEEEMLGSKWTEKVEIRSAGERSLEATDLAVVEPDAVLQLVGGRGSGRWITVSAGPVSAGLGSVVVMRDVTAERSLERAKLDFLATVSHELRTPLTGIKGSLGVLESSATKLPPERLNRLIAVTRWGAERLERLVMNLLIVSEISTGDMPIKLESLELAGLVEERVKSMLGHHALVEVTASERPLEIRGDPERLEQVIDHLLDNAHKFGGATGTVSVSVRASDRHAEIAVSDQGPGIPQGDRQRIFERFVRLGDVMTRHTPGAGVGLYIVKRSIEAMDGEVEVQDVDGGGSTFLVRLPISP